MVAVKAYNTIVILVLFKELEGVIAKLEKNIKGGGLVIFPKIIDHFLPEYFIIVFPVADIDDQIVRQVFDLQVLGNFIDRVAVGFLQPRGRVGHSDHCVSYVGQIQIEMLRHCPLFGPCYNFSKLAYH